MSARLHTYREVHRLLDDAGFSDVQSFGSLTREPFQPGCPRPLFVATRR
jgi:hypothetical protein